VLYLYAVGKRVIDVLYVTAEELQAEISPIQRFVKGGASRWRYIWRWRVSVSPTSMYR